LAKPHKLDEEIEVTEVGDRGDLASQYKEVNNELMNLK